MHVGLVFLCCAAPVAVTRPQPQISPELAHFRGFAEGALR